MGLNEVKEEILVSAKKKAEENKKNAMAEIKKIEKEVDNEIKKLSEKAAEETEKNLSAFKMREIASATLEARKYLFGKKKELINNVFEEAKKEIMNMSKSQKTALLKNLLEKAKRETDVKYIYCSKEEKPLIKANNVTTVDISGGIIVENSDKTIRIDYSYETIMENIYDKIMQDVAETLF